jgi:hypothetical protein
MSSSLSTSRYELLEWINIDKLDWNALSGNKNAIDFLRKYPENIKFGIAGYSKYNFSFRIYY